MVCGLFLSSFLLRMLGDEEYGLYQTVAAFASYMVLLEFGLGTVMSRNLAVCRSGEHPEQADRHVATLWYVSLLLSLVITAVGAIFCLNIGTIYQKTITTPEAVRYAQLIFSVLAGHLILSFLDQTLNGVLLGMEQYTFHQAASVVRVLTRTVLLVLLIRQSPHALIIALVDLCVYAGLFASTLLFCKLRYRIRLSPALFDRHIFIQSLPLCLAMLIQAAVNQVNNNVDKFVIGITISLSSVSLYSISQYIYTMFTSLSTLPVALYMPQVARDMGRGLKGRELTDTLIPVCRLVVLLGGTVLGGFLAVGRPFVTLFYGADKTDAWVYALILMVPQFADVTAAIILNVLDVAGKRLFRSWVLLGSTVLNIVLTLWFIRIWGIPGAVISTAIATTAQVVIMSIYYQKKMGLSILRLYAKAWRGFLPIQIICGVAVLLGVRWLETVVSSPLILLTLGGAVYILLTGALILSWGLTPNEKLRLRYMRKKL